MKKIAVFLLLLLAACNSDEREVQVVSEKFFHFLTLLRHAQYGGEVMEARRYRYSRLSDSEFQVDVFARTKEHSEKDEYSYLQFNLRKYSGDGWAVYKWGMRDSDGEWKFLDCAYSLGNRELDSLTANMSKITSPQPSTQIEVAEQKMVDVDERKQILDALRTPVAFELKQDVKFVVKELTKCNSWVLVFAKPVQTDGSPVDYSRTSYQAQIDDGVFDEGVLALLRFKNGAWLVAEFTIGGSDTPIQDWVAKYDMEECGSSFGVISNEAR